MYNAPSSSFGGWAAQAIGFLFLVFFVLLLIGAAPPYVQGEGIWPHIAADYVLALVGLLGLAAVPAITAPVRSVHPEFIRWSSNLAVVGFAVLAVTSFWQAEYETALHIESLSTSGSGWADPAVLESQVAAELTSRLPHGWLEVGGIGAWILAVSLAARRHSFLTAGAIRLGLAAGVLALVTPVANTLQLNALATGSQLLYGLLLGPVWFTWVGSHLLYRHAESPAAVEAPVRRTASRLRSAQFLRPALKRWTDRRPSMN